MAYLCIDFQAIDECWQVVDHFIWLIAFSAFEFLLLGKAVAFGLEGKVGISCSKVQSCLVHIELVRQLEASTAAVDHDEHEDIEGRHNNQSYN